MPPAKHGKEIFVVTGMSGAGKSQALKVFEDLGFFCVDNLPISMLQGFTDYLERARRGKTALGLDARGKEFVRGFRDALAELRAKGWTVRVVFLDATDTVLQTRFSETRRRHPLGKAVTTAIAEERRLLRPIKALAAKRFDTSASNVRQLRARIAALAGVSLGDTLEVRFMSFGFKHGVPNDADVMMDVRFLPNPYWDLALRAKTGLDKPVQAFLKKQAEVKMFLKDFEALVSKLLPAYVREGKSYLTVALGCTGGQHRSVYLAHELGRRFKAKVFHRDVQRRW